MSHTSPASFLVWAIISVMLGAFLVYHLWSFDRFKCLKWDNSPYSGAFKRVMTYSYLLSVPLIITFAVGFAIIKYYEGYIYLPTHGVVPKPWQMWGEVPKSALLPLLLMFSIAWSLEMVTHLEELCFWLFLVNSGSAQQDWFRSLYFRTWVVGSICAVIYMPLVTIFTRHDPLKSEAFTFLAGSLGSLSLTIWFTPILWTFPKFLDNLRADGVEQATVIRLTKFHELNSIRVIFRFLFTVPLVILGVDGVRPHKHVNESQGWTDFLTMISAFGCAVSSAITLVIFFPRSFEGEIAARDRRRGITTANLGNALASMHESRAQQSYAPSVNSNFNAPTSGTYLISPTKEQEMESQDIPMAGYTSGAPSIAYGSELAEMGSVADGHRKSWVPPETWEPASTPAKRLPPLRPNRRVNSQVEIGTLNGSVTPHGPNQSTAGFSNSSRRRSAFNPIVHDFRSPIDFAHAPTQTLAFPNNESRLTFTRR